MSFTKYYEEDRKNGISYDRAFIDGLGYRGPVYPLREREYLEVTTEVRDFHSRVFDLSDKDQHEEYIDIMDRIVNERCWLISRNDRWEEGQSHPKIYLEWMDRTLEADPKQLSRLGMRVENQ